MSYIGFQKNPIINNSSKIDFPVSNEGFIEVMPSTEFFDVANIEFNLPVDSEQINITLDALPESSAVSLEIELWNGSVWVSTGFEHHIATQTDTSALYSSIASNTNTITSPLGNLVTQGLALDIAITGHQAGIFPVIKVEGVAVNSTDDTTKIEGMLIQSSTQEYTKGRVLMSADNIADGIISVWASHFGAYLPLVAGNEINLDGEAELAINLVDNPLNCIAIGNFAPSTVSSLRITVITTSEQVTANKMHHEKTQSSSVNYSANNGSNSNHIDLLTSVDSVAGKQGISNVMIPNPSNSTLFKTIASVGGNYDSSNNSRNGHTTAFWSGGTDALTAVNLKTSSGVLTTGKVRGRSLKYYLTKDLGKSVGPFTFLSVDNPVASSSFEIELSDACAIRHIIYVYDLVVSVDNSFLNLQFFQDGIWQTTNNQYHISQTKSNNSGYAGANSTTASTFPFLRVGNAAGETAMCIYTISQCVTGGMVVSNGCEVNSIGNAESTNAVGRTASQAKVEKIRFVPSAGTFTANILHYEMPAPAATSGFDSGFDLGFGLFHPFQASFDTTQAGSASDTLILPISTDQNLQIDWGDGNGFVTALTVAEYTNVYSVGGTYTVTIREINMGRITDWKYNNLGDKAKIIDVSFLDGLDFGTDSSGAFYGCLNMNFINNAAVVGPKTDLVTVSTSMLRACTALTIVPLMDFGSLITANAMFQDDVNLTTLPLFNFISLNSSGGMCNGCTGLTSLPLWNLSNATLILFMCNGCTGLTALNSIPAWDLSSMTDGTDVFLGVTLNTIDWSNLLIKTELVNSNSTVTFTGGNSLHNVAGGVARDALIADHSWTIPDGGAA